jgi:hypothetical protein
MYKCFAKRSARKDAGIVGFAAKRATTSYLNNRSEPLVVCTSWFRELFCLGLPTVPVFTGVAGAVDGWASRPVEPLDKTIDRTGTGGR